MKKLASFLLLFAFLAVPMSASAYYIGTYEMDANASGPTWDGGDNNLNYYTDYDAATNPLGGITEMFCVEGNAEMIDAEVDYDFYTIDDNLSNYGVSDAWISSLKEATWYANWFVNQTGDSDGDYTYGDDDDKNDAQIAVWDAIGWNGAESYLQDNNGDADYASADDKHNYTSNWSLAVSPSDKGKSITMGVNGQNYIVQNPSPTPEPATMVLFGIGLLGIGGVLRKRRGK